MMSKSPDNLDPTIAGDGNVPAVPLCPNEVPLSSGHAERALHGISRAGNFVGKWALRALLPIVGAGAMLHAQPYEGTAGGVGYAAEGTLFGHPGITLETNIGNYEYSKVDGLPMGVTISPNHIDVLSLYNASSNGGDSITEAIQTDFKKNVSSIELWLGLETLLGVGGGLAVGAAINNAVLHYRGEKIRPDELRHRSRQLAAATSVAALIAGYGVATWNPDWQETLRVTDTLATIEALPGDVSHLYDEQSKAGQILSGINSIRNSAATTAEGASAPAFKIMTISDMHLAATYPQLAQYAKEMGVSLIINVGDETKFGTTIELTDSYIKSMEQLSAVAPILWIAGNHDSPAVLFSMANIPGVTVLGYKERSADGYKVSAQQINAYGLEIIGVPDPRVYGGPGAYGSDDPKLVDPLEAAAMRQALQYVDPSKVYDIAATHEPSAANVMQSVLGGQIREDLSGHLHEQNDPSQIQSSDGTLHLVEGSSGAGGLEATVQIPMEFSVETVASDCQFSSIERFSLAPTVGITGVPSSVSTSINVVGLMPQQVEGRICDTSLGIGEVSTVTQKPIPANRAE